MEQQRNVEIFGDSILKGVQLDDGSLRYHVDNNIDVDMLEKKFLLNISNFSKFGCTISKAYSLIEKRFKGGRQETNDNVSADIINNISGSNISTGNINRTCDAIVLNLGGNDCDFDWRAVAERPDEDHQPNTPLDVFSDTYKKIIEFLKENGVRPILTNLPPLDAQKFYDWFCGGIDKSANILKWLGTVESIYRWQENYSRTIEKIAEETGTLLVDLRGAFLKHRKLEHLLCADGTHPNTEGQRVITQGFLEFIEKAKATGKIAIYA